MFKRRKMRFNGEWSLLAGNRVYELKEPEVPGLSISVSSETSILISNERGTVNAVFILSLKFRLMNHKLLKSYDVSEII